MGRIVTWGKVVLIKVVLLGRITAKSSVQGLELQTAGILETVGQVTSRTAMSGHVFVRVRGSCRGGTVVWCAYILKLCRERSFISKNVILSNFEPLEPIATHSFPWDGVSTTGVSRIIRQGIMSTLLPLSLQVPKKLGKRVTGNPREVGGKYSVLAVVGGARDGTSRLRLRA